MQGIAKIHQGARMIGAKRQHLPVPAFGFHGPAFGFGQEAEIQVGFGQVGFESQGVPVVGCRVFKPPLPMA